MGVDRLLDRLDHILRAIAAIEDYTAGKGPDEYRTNRLLVDAVERNIERLSEASRHIPDHLKDRHPHIPWREIAGIGNILRHGYDAIDLREIWDTVQNDLIPLREAVAAMRRDAEAEK